MERIIAFALLYVISFIWNISANYKLDKFLSAFILTKLAMMLVALISSYENRNTPTAKDVYEGKTTIEITYKDSIPIDTIVVLKPEFKKSMEE